MLGPVEAEVMGGLWDADGACTPREVLEHLNARRASPLAYTTIMTVMARLAENPGDGVRDCGGRQNDGPDGQIRIGACE